MAYVWAMWYISTKEYAIGDASRVKYTSFEDLIFLISMLCNSIEMQIQLCISANILRHHK